MRGVKATRMIKMSLVLLAPLLMTTSEPGMPSADFHEVRAYVTGYNTVPAQTDDTPCIGASGKNICGRRDAVACPRKIDLGTVVVIRGATYTCEDRLARKFDRRFDISCDKDAECPARVTGWEVVKVFD